VSSVWNSFVRNAAVVAVLSLFASSAAAVSLSGPVTISSGCCSAPRNTSYVFDPNGSPVEINGWVDVSGLPVGSAIFLGLVSSGPTFPPARS
jgi:hypothetical protein